MTERDIELAKQAGYFLYDMMETNGIRTVETNSLDEWPTLEKLINLVRADEREACAKFFENHWREEWTDEQIAEAIRARGNT